MLRFECDYQEGCHPRILERLAETNFEPITGYGEDPYCASAREKIRAACGMPDAVVHFLVGGTQSNSTVIAAVLRNYEGVIAAESGHIAVHEAGAVEASGHKVITLPARDGKLNAADVEAYLQTFYGDDSWPHMVIPGMVYLSQPTETGTLYTRAELERLREVCDRYRLCLFADGARLGYGLAAQGADVTLPDMGRLCHIFSIGGTKVGALFGEAVVISGAWPVPHFFTTVKQRGGLLAKGWLLGLQFDVLFTDGLYLEIAAHAVRMAMRLKEGLVRLGYPLYADSPTNQQFVVLSRGQIAALAGRVTDTFWKALEDGAEAVRFATSWATKEEDVDALLSVLAECREGR